MPLPDLWKYLFVAAVVAGYWAWANRSGLVLAISSLLRRPPAAPSPPKPVHDQAEWLSGSVATLLALRADMEARGLKDAAALARELVWRLLGGKPHDA